MKVILVILPVALLAGCAHLPWIRAGGVAVQGPRDAGTPATIAKLDSGVSLSLPAGSLVVKREIKGIAYRPATNGQPAQKATPDETVTEFYPSGPTEYHETKESVNASSGTVDTSIAAKRIEAQENRVLLYASIAMMIAAGVFFWLQYPTPSLLCAGGAGVLFLAWKLAGLPEWFWALALLAGGGALGVYLGHHRGINESAAAEKKPTP